MYVSNTTFQELNFIAVLDKFQAIAKSYKKIRKNKMVFGKKKNIIVKNEKHVIVNNDGLKASVGLRFSRYLHKSFLTVLFTYIHTNISKYISKKLSLYFSIAYKYYQLVILRVIYDICKNIDIIKDSAKFSKKEKNKKLIINESDTKIIVKNRNVEICFLSYNTVYSYN